MSFPNEGIVLYPSEFATPIPSLFVSILNGTARKNLSLYKCNGQLLGHETWASHALTVDT